MGTDDVAILWARDRANHRSAFTRAGCAPVDRVVVLGTRCRVRGNTNMVNPIGTSHRHGPLNGDGPPMQTGLVTNDHISSAAAAESGSIVESRLNTTAIRTPDALVAGIRRSASTSGSPKRFQFAMAWCHGLKCQSRAPQL